MGRKYSTVEVAKQLGILQPNLQKLIKERRVEAPPLQTLGGMKIRLWTKKDIEKARKAIGGK